MASGRLLGALALVMAGFLAVPGMAVLQLIEPYSVDHPDTQVYLDTETGQTVVEIGSGPHYLAPGKSTSFGARDVTTLWFDTGYFYGEYNRLTGRTAVMEWSTGQWTNWTPRIYLNNVTQIGLGSTAVVHAVDPLNPYYFNNVVDIAYGSNVTRRIRVIEGSFQEFYIIKANPGGSILIAPILETHDLPSRAYYIEDNGTFLQDGFSYNMDTAQKYIQSTYFGNASFPVTTDDSFKNASWSNDGYNEAASTTWSTVWNAATGTTTSTGVNLYVGTPKSGSTFYIQRGAVYFDTSTISVGATVTAAYLSLYATGGTGGNASATYNISDGQPTYPRKNLVAADYNRVNYPDSTVGYLVRPGGVPTFFNITIRSSKFSVINTTGANALTKLALQNSLDTENGCDTSTYLIFGTTEYGKKLEPTLYVTYTASASAPVAAFSCTPLAGVRNSTIACTDASTNTPTSWFWWVPSDDTQHRLFTNTTETTAQNPSFFPHFLGGYHGICLTATNAGGSGSTCKSKYIWVNKPIGGM